MSTAVKCANPTCENPGTKVCSACNAVWYCSGECQKSHWPAHKGPCKQNRPAKALENITAKSPKAGEGASGVFVDPAQPAGPSSPKPSSPSPEALKIANDVVIMRLQSIKQQIQAAFQGGDFTASIRLGHEAIGVANMIPEPGKSVELIQLHLNISSAYLQMGKLEDAEAQSLVCVEVAEKAVALRQKHPQSIDMLHVTLTNRTFILLNLNRLTDGEATGTKALALAEAIFPAGDVRLFKPLRAIGLIRAKQDKFDEAEQLLKRAYVCTMKGNGVCHGDTQTAVDDLVSLYIKKKDAVNAAEKLTKKNYDAMVESGVAKDNLLFGEAAAKYASILANSGRANIAEPYMQQALVAREKHHGSTSLAVGVSLMAIANIREACNNVSEDTERLLMRALDIFKTVEGPQSPHVLNAIAFIRRVQTRRGSIQGTGGRQGGQENDENDFGGVVTSESKAGGTGGGNKQQQRGQQQNNRSMLPRTDDGKPVPKFPPDDGISRLQHSAYYFETAQYWKAEILLQEAQEIFMRLHGPEHQHTQAATQNLTIVKHNAINQLWHEVAAEELEKLKAEAESSGGDDSSNSSSSSSTASANPFAPTNSNNSSSASGSKGAVTDKEVDEITSLFANAGKPRDRPVKDAWLYEDPNEGSGCTIC